MLPRSSTVQATLALELLDQGGGTTPIRGELRYDSRDPFAVSGDFQLDDQAVRWVFARSLLRTGLYEPTGAGDVRIRPALDETARAVVHVELSSPDGTAVLQARAADVATFLRRTEGLVPPGCESAHVDLDHALTQLLDQPA